MYKIHAGISAVSVSMRSVAVGFIISTKHLAKKKKKMKPDSLHANWLLATELIANLFENLHHYSLEQGPSSFNYVCVHVFLQYIY